MDLFWFLAFPIQSLFLHSLFSFTLICGFPSVQPASCHEHESSALLKFKESFVISKSASYYPFSYPKTVSWIQNTDCCSWDGVECDELTGHVTDLDLSSSQLYGSINSNSSLFQLAQLQSLNLADNNFSYSQIPSRLGHLSRLKHLNLSLSQFFGEIPPEISHLSKLVSLDLTSNVYNPYPINLLRLSEPNLRRLVQNSTNIEILVLTYVTIASRVPDILANQTSLMKLSLYNCEMYGEFPVGIFYLPKLKYLGLGCNQNLIGKLPEFHSGGLINVLVLAATSFNGTLPSSIGNLSSLNFLSISQCKFGGSIPSSLGNLTQLAHLDIRYNNFEGYLSSSLSNLKNLRTLQVGYNKLSAQTISWIGKLTRLNYLDLSSTNIGPEIPDSFSNLTQLCHLYVMYSNLRGEIPSKIMNLTNLISLDLRENDLWGEIPRSLFTLEKLEFLSLDLNRLSGRLNLQLLLKLERLIFLSLSYNNLTFFTKTNSSNVTLPQIQVLDVSSCNITKFPEFLQGQDELQYLAMSDNNIQSLPNWLWSKKSLEILFISGSSLAGEISPMICNLKSLVLLDLSFNNFSGRLPPCLVRFSQSLRELNLQRNNLFGLIPQSYEEGNALKMVDFSQNNLQGQLPKALTNCRLLEYLDVSHNQISDSFPFWLGTLPELKVLGLRYNKFFGTIRCQAACPFPKLHIIDLSHNGFVGNFPTMVIQGWKSMRASDANVLKYEEYQYYPKHGQYWSQSQIYSFTMNNKGIEMVYERLQQFYNFIAIDFSSNKIGGEMSEVIGELSGLVLLNLSNNILTGGIPSSLRKLSKLEALDLSHNSLSGRIPPDLIELTFLEFFDVSYNNLRGPIPKDKQFATFSRGSFEGNQGLCGDPLLKKCEDDASSSLAPPGFDDDRESEFLFEFGWKVVLMGYGCGFAVGMAIGCTLSSEKHEWLLGACRRKWQSRK